jgi:hypothetical protein
MDADRIFPAQNMIQLPANVDKVMNLQVSQKAGQFLDRPSVLHNNSLNNE